MSTKFYRNNKPNPYADIPVSISTNEDDEDDIYCPSCHCNTLVGGDDGDYFCTRCQRTVIMKQEVEVADIVESESMDSHGETLGSHLPDPNDSFHRRGRVEPQGAFKALQDKGIRLTSYTERSGDGHVTSSWNDGSNSSSSSDRKVSAPRPLRFTD